MREEQILLITLIDGRNPLFKWFNRQLDLHNIIIDLNFYTKNKEHLYGFRFGPSDRKGQIRITYGDVKDAILQNRLHQPWDYKIEPEAFDDRLFLTLPSYSELEWAYEVNKTFNQGTPEKEAEAWLASNNANVRSNGRFVTLDGKETRCSLQCFPMR